MDIRHSKVLAVLEESSVHLDAEVWRIGKQAAGLDVELATDRVAVQQTRRHGSPLRVRPEGSLDQSDVIRGLEQLLDVRALQKQGPGRFHGWPSMGGLPDGGQMDNSGPLQSVSSI